MYPGLLPRQRTWRPRLRDPSTRVLHERSAWPARARGRLSDRDDPGRDAAGANSMNAWLWTPACSITASRQSQCTAWSSLQPCSLRRISARWPLMPTTVSASSAPPTPSALTSSDYTIVKRAGHAGTRAPIYPRAIPNERRLPCADVQRNGADLRGSCGRHDRQRNPQPGFAWRSVPAKSSASTS